MTTFEVRGVPGLPQIRRGDDLAGLIAAAVPDLRDGDIVAVTSKIVSKAEGRLLSGVDRDEVIDAETVRVIAEWTTPRGRTRIAQTRHGFVLAAAGVDASNTEPGTVVLLPDDPDASARALRAELRSRAGVDVGVVVTDTAGRPWRDGVVDFAVGAAGVVVRDDLRGRTDDYGNELGVTVVATADELAAASELVRGKLDGVPVAIIRGLESLVTGEDGAGVTTLVRPADEDRFRLGTPEAMRAAVLARRDITEFTAQPVDGVTVRRAIAAAQATPPPPGGRWRFVLVESEWVRIRLGDAMLDAWVSDLRADGLSEPEIAERTASGTAVREAASLVVAFLDATRADPELGVRRIRARHHSDLLAGGAAVQNLLVTLASDGLGAWWSHAPLYCPDAVRTALAVPAGWEPMGAIAIGHPVAPAVEADQHSAADDAVIVR